MLERNAVSWSVASRDAPEHISLEANEEFIYLKHCKYHQNDGIAGILSLPQTKEGDIPFVLLLHGMQSDKNANYQALLASKLSAEGYAVLRIDFRSVGDSEPNTEDCRGRTIEQDLQDIDTVYQFTRSRFGGLRLQFKAIVAHSRGVISMFEYAKRFEGGKNIPHLINCSGRFHGKGLYDKTCLKHPNWLADHGYSVQMPRHGKWVETWIPQEEILSAVNVDTTSYDTEIPAETRILTCHGSKDQVVPVQAAYDYATVFNNRHILQIVSDADHNYYGLPDDPNRANRPTYKSRVDYRPDLVNIIVRYLEEN